MQKQSFGSVTIFSIDEEEVRRCVDEYAAQLLASHPDIEEVVVFGSFVKGNYAPGSDVDIFILLSGSDKPRRDRASDFMPRRFPVPVDLFPLTREEVATLGSSAMLAEIQASPWRYRR
jgi:predicted nucleotidyltransferase